MPETGVSKGHQGISSCTESCARARSLENTQRKPAESLESSSLSLSQQRLALSARARAFVSECFFQKADAPRFCIQAVPVDDSRCAPMDLRKAKKNQVCVSAVSASGSRKPRAVSSREFATRLKPQETKTPTFILFFKSRSSAPVLRRVPSPKGTVCARQGRRRRSFCLGLRNPRPPAAPATPPRSFFHQSVALAAPQARTYRDRSAVAPPAIGHLRSYEAGAALRPPLCRCRPLRTSCF